LAETERSSFSRGPAANLWRNTLNRIPTLFGRLVYLASLRNQNSGSYEHHGLANIFGEEESDQTLRHSHAQVFNEWLCCNLQQQKADLDDYFSALEGSVQTVLATWIRLTPYRNFIPAAAREVEQQLFLRDLETLLELLKREHGVASPDREA
jgi:hypothetical protein